MNLLDIRAEVPNHGFDPVLFPSSRIDAYINDGQWLIARRVAYYNSEAAFAIPTVAGQSSYPLPDGWAQIRYLVDTDRDYVLPQVSLRDIDSAQPSYGVPGVFTVDGPNVHLYPTPDGPYDLELRYWLLPPQLVSDQDVPSLPADWHRILWIYGCWQAYESEDDGQMAQYWQGRFTSELAEFSADARFPSNDFPTQLESIWGEGVGKRPYFTIPSGRRSVRWRQRRRRQRKHRRRRRCWRLQRCA